MPDRGGGRQAPRLHQEGRQRRSSVEGPLASAVMAVSATSLTSDHIALRTKEV